MSIGSLLSSVAGNAVGVLAPQTGPAVAGTVTTVTSGDVPGVGHSVDIAIDAVGADTTSSTILHGLADAVTSLSNTGISTVTEPVAQTLLAPVTSASAGALGTPLTLVVPHDTPAAATLLHAVGGGNVAEIGHALSGVVNATGVEIAQSTILHGVAGAVTAVGSVDGFHFTAPASGGSDALSGILHSVTSGVGAHAASASGSPLQAIVSHVDAPVDTPHPLADLAHAIHHG